jgi:SAM-dependent methyltransferase
VTEANRRAWNAWSEDYQRQHGPQLDTRPKAWGGFALPEADVRALPDLTGKRVLELGCGGGQWSMFLAREGVDVTGLDLSEKQLETAARLTAGLDVPLVQAAGEAPPFAAGAFDVVFCDHGAMTWGDPYRTVPEVARLLAPGGVLVFNAATPWLSVCWDDELDAPGDRLRKDYFGLHAEVGTDGDVSYALPYGEWIRLFRANGLVVDDLIELQPPADATTTYTFLGLEWARRWPGEQIWVVSKPTP